MQGLNLTTLVYRYLNRPSTIGGLFFDNILLQVKVFLCPIWVILDLTRQNGEYIFHNHLEIKNKPKFRNRKSFWFIND